MSAVTEAAIALEWLYTTLSEDQNLSSIATGGVYRAFAPPSTQPPYVIIAYQSGTDTLSMNAFRLLSQLLYQVKVVGPGNTMSALVEAASQIDTLLRLASGSATGGLVLSCYREQPLQVDELVNGVLWTNIGGLYRTIIQQTS